MHRPSFGEVARERQRRGSRAQGMEFNQSAVAGISPVTAAFLENLKVIRRADLC